MPTSALELVQPIVYQVWTMREELGRPLRILDVGPGWGKYAVLIREAADPDAQIDAIEIDFDYAKRHRLGALYDRVWVADVRDLSGESSADRRALLGIGDPHNLYWPGFAFYDLILLIDVLEHMPATDGLALLARIDPPILVSTPRHLFATPEEAPDLPPYEQHHALWGEADLKEAGRPVEIVHTGIDSQLVAWVGR